MALGSKNTETGNYRSAIQSIQDPSAMKQLHRGGHADETHDVMDFIPKTSDQDNHFEPVGSIDEKVNQVLSGDFGNGLERKRALGDEYAAIQAKVNKLYKNKNN